MIRGWDSSLATTIPGRSISSSLELTGMYQFNQVEFHDRHQRFIAHIGRLKLLAMFSIKLSASAFIQYNSASDVVITNFRLRYNPSEGNDLYLSIMMESTPIATVRNY